MPDVDADPRAAADPAVARWFLEGPVVTEGNLVRPLVHGSTYFRRLHDELQQLQAGDRVYFTDWRGDADERLLPEGPTVGELLCTLLDRGVEVRGLVWRSHSDLMAFSSSENEKLGRQLNEAGGQVLLDQRVRWFGSHHQKLVVLRHGEDQSRDVAFVGGIDLCHGRRDDAEHGGDPQTQPIDDRYGETAPWHDAMLELRGPVVGEVLRTFVERWDDPHPLDRRTPYRMLLHRLAKMPRHPEALPEAFPDPDEAGPHAVQLLRTYGRRRPRYPFAPEGERTVARAYGRAFALARSFVYLEDQYLWSEPVARGIADALRSAPDLRLIAVVPRFPDADGAVTGPPNRLGQLRAMQVLQDVAPDRVAFFDLENAQGVPIYVHAKICIVDDVWFTCGSDNFNLRSWTNDSELTCAVLDPTRDEREPRDLSGSGDGARRLARDLRLETWSEHLGVDVDDPVLLDPATAWPLWSQRAEALDAWHAGGQQGPRPPGQVRRHRPDPVGRVQRLWAEPVYRVVFDPDGRTRRERRRGEL
ncbi:MAG: phospholipase [Frankiales bacterium]|nr:phospholipase [Frankiales bacterium]